MRALDSHCIPEKELYKRSKVQIVGVSRDPVGKQKAFVEKEKLTVRESQSSRLIRC